MPPKFKAPPEPPDLLTVAGLDGELGFVLRMAQLAVFDDLIGRLKKTGLRPSAVTVLRLVRARPGLNQQQIGDALKIQKPNLVALIGALHKSGLIDRQPSPDDKRSYALHLTEPGKKALAKAMRQLSAHLQWVSGHINEAEQTRLIKLLNCFHAPE